MSFDCVRATDLPSNKDIVIPSPVAINIDIKIQTMQQEQVGLVSQHDARSCKNNGEIRDSNFLQRQRKVDGLYKGK